ncbi:MAG: hypothetical protein K2L97_00735 [Muribaculaceae bacterium]|nr:hypothetical protein [Muribaculaceae bacterium]
MVDYKKYYNKIAEELRTTTGRNVLTFLVFLCISTVFWFLMALNDEIQEDYRIPLRLEGFPKNVTIISGNVPTVNVTVKDKGSALMKYAWGADPVLKLRYADFSRTTDNYLLLTEAQLNSALRGIFGTSASIVAVRPDSLHLYYTTNPGLPVRVIVDADITTQPQYEAFGAPIISSDSVMLYSNDKSRLQIKELMTSPISLSDLSDTTTVEVSLVVPDGMKAVPSKVKVTFPIEPLVTKTRKLQIETVNVPRGTRLIPFPAVVEATYLLPKSTYSSSNCPLRAVVDYDDITPDTKSLHVRLLGVPPYYKSARLLTPEVEYLIEKE